MGSGNINNANGLNAVLQRTAIVEHVIDDDDNNKLGIPAYLSVGGEAVGNVRALVDKRGGGQEVVDLIDYSVLEPAIVYKVYLTGTDTALIDKISLWD